VLQLLLRELLDDDVYDDEDWSQFLHLQLLLQLLLRELLLLGELLDDDVYNDEDSSHFLILKNLMVLKKLLRKLLALNKL